jgi:uncharacterized protein (DUF305 family)
MRNLEALSTRHWRTLLSHAIAISAGIVLAVTFLSHATSRRTPPDKGSLPATASDFDRALRAAMLRMGSEMCLVPSGDADRDFVRAMIPHHQGAIEMARLELLYGRDDRLRRLAQGIVIEQSQEIALMRNVLDTDALLASDRPNQ